MALGFFTEITAEEIKAELTLCLAQQIQLQEQADKLTERFKAILEAMPNQRIITEIDGQLYELTNCDETQISVENAQKFHGSYAQYRLVTRGKLIR